MGRKQRLPAEPFEAEVTALDGHGAGLATHNERQLRVWGGLPGERVMARHLFGRRFRGQAETLEVLEASARRVTPRCPYFGTCSACAFQHLHDDDQLAFKQQRLFTMLDEAGAGAPESPLAPLSAGRWHYRRKARLSVRDVPAKGRVLVGFRERDGRFVMDMNECHTLADPVASRLPAISELVGELEARAQLPQIEASCGDSECALVFRHMEPLSDNDLDRLQRFEADTGLRVYLQSKGPETVTPLVEGPSRLSYTLPAHDIEMVFEPLDFVQVNGELNRSMIDQALSLLELSASDRVLDLFCGLGNFTLPLARHCDHVVGLEGAESLVGRARDNAKRNGIDNVDYHAVDLYADPASVEWPVTGAFDAVLLDPPRPGAGPLLERVAATGARRLLYVSCNPETLASDARELIQVHGYRLATAGIMDMFPQTAHIEAMALFEKN
ncbi:23S rRNA (uracil(1939)-C(5))-methyltransferase RlmD [Marinihelvus fidelis]|uniref:23S rRNA (uracil(1939)-C(5))-methyltransferase RlmD n=1 Tax=Marinihelvus fidelis TaxID=2613842 RepID=A0A5N0TFL5_9GAMM|nr:23S rRNA (uracil(1939)-C(5))-methyltransferase RlmD [Marinihelvus fidelis]KAA9133264.1 23S rRNA (uracil(1939)-C(5))-methyltransferase RlmD [Marinihelvus fidelis]